MPTSVISLPGRGLEEDVAEYSYTKVDKHSMQELNSIALTFGLMSETKFAGTTVICLPSLAALTAVSVDREAEIGSLRENVDVPRPATDGMAAVGREPEPEREFLCLPLSVKSAWGCFGILAFD